MEIEVKVSYTKKISRCYHECPYFKLDGGPGPVMYCGHPYFNGEGFSSRFIIDHPKCDNGFPDKCPLVLDYELLKDYL